MIPTPEPRGLPAEARPALPGRPSGRSRADLGEAGRAAAAIGSAPPADRRSDEGAGPAPQRSGGVTREEEVALVRACVAGDPEAWRRFDQRFRPIVARVARDVCARAGVGDAAAAAEDVAADVLAALLADGRRALDRFEGRAAVATWLAVLARRQAARHCDRLKRGPRPTDLGGEGAPEPAATDAGPSARVEAQERRALVQAQLARLSPRDRLALQLFYEGGRSYREVATILGLPAARVGTLLMRARQRLGRALGLLS